MSSERLASRGPRVLTVSRLVRKPPVPFTRQALPTCCTLLPLGLEVRKPRPSIVCEDIAAASHHHLQGPDAYPLEFRTRIEVHGQVERFKRNSPVSQELRQELAAQTSPAIR